MMKKRGLPILFAGLLLGCANKSTMGMEPQLRTALTRLSPHKGVFYALVVGLNEPSDRGFETLNNAEREASNMKALLDSNGYNTTLLEKQNATRTRIEGWFNTIRPKTRDTDRVLFFFAGHGMNVNGFHLALWRSRKDQASRISVAELTQIMHKDTVLQSIVIIDACYSGLAERPSLNVSDFKHSLLTDNNFFVLTGWHGKVGADTYTPNLIAGLDGEANRKPHGDSNGVVDVFEITRYMNYINEKRCLDIGKKCPPYVVFMGAGELPLTVPGRLKRQ